jgi:lysophospholipid acyltransferase (LPLAT)-like uncharacterized protein
LTKKAVSSIIWLNRIPAAAFLVAISMAFTHSRTEKPAGIYYGIAMNQLRVLAFILAAVISLWSRTFKVRFVNRETPERLTAEGQSVIYAFWHGSLFLLPSTHRKSGVVIMVSESRDGEVMAGLLKYFGFGVTRGSSKRKGDRGLLGLIRALRNGRSVAIAVDGPRGPLHKVKDGVVFLAGREQAPIIPVVTGAKRFRVLEGTWEKLVVPAPFTEGIVLYGDPIFVNGTTEEEIERKRRELEAVLNRLTREAAERAAGQFEPRRIQSVEKKGAGSGLPLDSPLMKKQGHGQAANFPPGDAVAMPARRTANHAGK